MDEQLKKDVRLIGLMVGLCVLSIGLFWFFVTC
jgi:hypothetical protein